MLLALMAIVTTISMRSVHIHVYNNYYAHEHISIQCRHFWNGSRCTGRTRKWPYQKLCRWLVVHGSAKQEVESKQAVHLPLQGVALGHMTPHTVTSP